jgi:hypothetical protein
MASDEVELELGFENGGLLRCSVGRAEATRVVEAFGGAPRELFALTTAKGRVVIDLRRVAYVRELTQRHVIGFGLRAT